MVKDGLVEIHKDSILLTEVGQVFTDNNECFDKYDPPNDI